MSRPTSLTSDSQADAARWFLDHQQAHRSGTAAAYWAPHWAQANTVAALHRRGLILPVDITWHDSDEDIRWTDRAWWVPDPTRIVAALANWDRRCGR